MKAQISLQKDDEMVRQIDALAERWGLAGTRHTTAVIQRCLDRVYTLEFGERSTTQPAQPAQDDRYCPGDATHRPRVGELAVPGFYLVEPMIAPFGAAGASSEGIMFPSGVMLAQVLQMDDTFRWSIRPPNQEPGMCMNGLGEWEWEPLPSERTDEFLGRCRFVSVADALVAWEQYLQKHPETRAIIAEQKRNRKEGN